ncbi:MAG: hypothetical protein ACRDYZ_02170 [Acidimicrobiales bacterium]
MGQPTAALTRSRRFMYPVCAGMAAPMVVTRAKRMATAAVIGCGLALATPGVVIAAAAPVQASGTQGKIGDHSPGSSGSSGSSGSGAKTTSNHTLPTLGLTTTRAAP